MCFTLSSPASLFFFTLLTLNVTYKNIYAAFLHSQFFLLLPLPFPLLLPLPCQFVLLFTAGLGCGSDKGRTASPRYWNWQQPALLFVMVTVIPVTCFSVGGGRSMLEPLSCLFWVCEQGSTQRKVDETWPPWTGLALLYTYFPPLPLPCSAQHLRLNLLQLPKQEGRNSHSAETGLEICSSQQTKSPSPAPTPSTALFFSVKKGSHCGEK